MSRLDDRREMYRMLWRCSYLMSQHISKTESLLVGAKGDAKRSKSLCRQVRDLQEAQIGILTAMVMISSRENGIFETPKDEE